MRLTFMHRCTEVYAAYLLFQLWSHTHLYKDNPGQQSSKLSVKLPETPQIFRVGKNRSRSPNVRIPREGNGEKHAVDSPSPSTFLPQAPHPFYVSQDSPT